MKKYLEKLGAAFQGRNGALMLAGLMYIVSLVLYFSPLHRLIEYRLYDFRFLMKPATPVCQDLVLINIDDASIASMGQFPWPRNYYASALFAMKSAGLDSILFDIQFMDYSPSLVDRVALREIIDRAGKGKKIGSDEISAAVIDNDAELAKALQIFGKAYIPYSFAKEKLAYRNLSGDEQKAREKGIHAFMARASIPVPDKRKDEFNRLIEKDRLDIQYPIPPLAEGAHAFGYVDSDFDEDGTVRKVRLVRVFQDRIYFHLALTAVMDMCGVKRESLEINPGKNIILKNAFNPMNGQRGDIPIPVDDDCAVLINWAGSFAEAFRHLPVFALFEYQDVADSMDLQLSLKDMASGNQERGALAEELTGLRIAITSERDPQKKFNLKKEYHAKLARYNAIVEGYVAAAKADLEKLRAAGGKGSPEEENSFLDFISAVKVKMGVDSLFGSTAVIGLTASATQDIGVTPLANDYMMVGSYPNVMNTILSGEFIRKTGLLLNFFLMLIFAFAVPLYIHDKSSKHSISVIVTAFIVINGAYSGMFMFAGLWLDQLGANFSLLLPAGAIVVLKFTGEERQKQFIKGAFSKYLSEGVIEQIIKDPESLKLGGDSREITIFFSDVAGFSTISEALTPEQLVQLLNEYLSEMTDIIMNNDGTVDKYEGDAIMAFWGAPFHFPDHAYKACISAVKMQRRLVELRDFWRKQGRHELTVRMGINSGPAVAGNMGSRTRMNYTVMGDSVNLASRLEGANKFYGTYTMVSESTHAHVADKFHFRELDIIRVVGKHEPIRVYELLEESGKLDPEMMEVIQIYDEGLELFRERNWQKAKLAFNNVLKIDPNDGPSKTYVERCREFMKNPPSVKWDGVYSLKSK